MDVARPHLYVFEDDPDMSALLLEVLVEDGYRVTRFDAPQFSSAEAARDPPVLVVVDLRLGAGGDAGLEVIRGLREVVAPSRLPAILLTGDLNWIRHEAPAYGGIRDLAVLPKPFMLDALAELLAAMRLVDRPSRDALLAAEVGVLIADAESRYVAANRAAQELLGYTVHELQQMRVEDVMTATPDETAREWDHYVRDRSWARPAVLRHKDGSQVRVLIRASVIAGADEVLYVAWLRPAPP